MITKKQTNKRGTKRKKLFNKEKADKARVKPGPSARKVGY